MKLNKVLFGITLAAITQTVIAAEPAPVVDVTRGNTSFKSLSIQERLDQLERKLDARNRAQVNVQRQLDELQNEVNELRGVTELHTHQLSQVLERQRELYQELDRRVSQALKPANSVPASIEAPANSVQANYSSNLTENEAYDRALNLVLKDKVIGPSAWRGCDLVNDNSWVYQLSDDAIALINQALNSVKNRGLSFPNFKKEDFPIQALSKELQSIAEELENGKGFLLIRGLPIAEHSDEDINTLYYGLGLHLGDPVYQNPKGDLLGKVMNVGDLNDKETRVYETNAYLPYHTDPSDVFGLLCVRGAKSGGRTSLVSTGAVYNALLENHPELLGLYYRPMYYAHLGEGTSRSPIFSYNEGKLSCRYLRQYIELGHEQHDRPLSQVEIASLDVFDNVIHDEQLRLDMTLQPGDMLFANNYAVMHSRTSFEDFESLEQRRKLLRLWLKMGNARVLATDFPGKNGFPAPNS